MYDSLRRQKENVGQIPGALIHIGEQKVEQPLVQLIEFDGQGHFVEQQLDTLDTLPQLIQSPTIAWIHVIGLHETSTIQQIGQALGIHSLLLEDILNTEQRPKIEDYETYLYLVLKRLLWNKETAVIEMSQVSIIFGSTFVLTFQEDMHDIFDPLRQRLRAGKGRLRKAGADYLAYTLLDVIVDHYFLLLEQLGDRLEAVEDTVITTPTPNTLQMIYGLKRELLFLRKAVWPLRELLNNLQHSDSDLVQSATRPYLRDVYDHTIQVLETMEILREVVSSLLDIYLSSVSMRTNDVMKILTVIATIFIPLTFITSLYGMNFHNMPELQWRYGYLFVWIIILISSGTLLLFFKRRGWL